MKEAHRWLVAGTDLRPYLLIPSPGMVPPYQLFMLFHRGLRSPGEGLKRRGEGVKFCGALLGWNQVSWSLKFIQLVEG